MSQFPLGFATRVFIYTACKVNAVEKERFYRKCVSERENFQLLR